MDKKAEVEDNVLVGPRTAEEDIEHSKHEDGEEEESDTTSTNLNLNNYQLARDRVRRDIRTPLRFGHVDMVSFALWSAQGLEFKEPSSYGKAVTCSDSKKWKFAMLEGMKCHNPGS